ncbi:MAG TPA: prenyltransferase/squalene oxidase repeat-containing protein [Pirellulales bacterium]|nr:prenyltransferase/squalene oxidase repeat-containing protein [Pirellulales bacterium]
MTPLKTRIALAFVAVLFALSGLAQAAEPEDGPLDETRIVQEVTTALDKALAYLAENQRPDGGWHDNNAPNALAILAMMGRGHVPGRGPYRDVLERGKKFILGQQQANGLFASSRPSHGPMYEHALTTLAMAEMYGMDPDPGLESAVRRSVDLIVSAQAANGGWRYQPQPSDADLSVTVMQIVALRAANNAEIPLPESTLDKAIAYVKSCAHPDGGFTYQTGGSPNHQMSAAGALSLQLLRKSDSDPEDPSIKKALDYLSSTEIKWQAGPVQYFYYFHYYAIQGHYQAGGKYWNDWHPRIRELLLSKQNADGSWDVPPGTAENEGVVGPNKVYWTAMASLVLEIYMHFLPAYQR